MKRGLSSFYGKDDFIGQLRDLGNDAVRRSSINRNNRGEHNMSIAEVGNVSSFQRISIFRYHCLSKFDHISCTI